MEKCAEGVYRMHMRNGMAPYPFIRPSVHAVQHRLEEDKDWWTREDGSLEKVAELVADEIEDTLRRNRMVFSGDLMNSIEVIPSEDVGPSALDDVPQEVLDSDTSDMYGDSSRYERMRSKRRH